MRQLEGPSILRWRPYSFTDQDPLGPFRRYHPFCLFREVAKVADEKCPTTVPSPQGTPTRTKSAVKDFSNLPRTLSDVAGVERVRTRCLFTALSFL